MCMALHCIIVLEFLRMHLREALGHLVPIKNLLGRTIHYDCLMII